MKKRCIYSYEFNDKSVYVGLWRNSVGQNREENRDPLLALKRKEEIKRRDEERKEEIRLKHLDIDPYSEENWFHEAMEKSMTIKFLDFCNL